MIYFDSSLCRDKESEKKFSKLTDPVLDTSDKGYDSMALFLFFCNSKDQIAFFKLI